MALDSSFITFSRYVRCIRVSQEARVRIPPLSLSFCFYFICNISIIATIFAVRQEGEYGKFLSSIEICQTVNLTA